MTESDWQTCTDPARMLRFLGRRTSDRKLRLFACACVRRVWRLLQDDRSRRTLAVAEDFAAGRLGGKELFQAQAGAWVAAAESAFILTGVAACVSAFNAGIDQDDNPVWDAVDAWARPADHAWFSACHAELNACQLENAAEHEQSRRQHATTTRDAFRAAAASDTPRWDRVSALVQAARDAAQVLTDARDRTFRLEHADRAAGQIRSAQSAGPDGQSGACALAAWAAAEAAGEDADAAAVAAEATRLAAGRRQAGGGSAEGAAQAGLLREVFGPLPFRDVNVEAARRRASVVALARMAYEERGFGDLPVLADALEEAGCASADLLGHLRGPGPHVLG